MRLVGYAIDLGTEVVTRSEDKKSALLAVTLSGDNVMLRFTLLRTTRYQIRNRNATDRTIVIEHPRTSGGKLVALRKPDDQTRDFYRFRRSRQRAGCWLHASKSRKESTQEPRRTHSESAREGVLSFEDHRAAGEQETDPDRGHGRGQQCDPTPFRTAAERRRT